MQTWTVNKEKVVFYVTDAGLTDLVLTVVKPDLSTLNPPVVEQGSGLYRAVYTPDVAGEWREEIASASNGDQAFRGVNIVGYDCDDLKAQTDALSVKLNTIESKIDALDGGNAGGYFA